MVTPETNLLVLLLDKDNWEVYGEFIDHKYLKENYKELYHLYLTLSELHGVKEDSVTLDELRAAFYTKHPGADRSLYDRLFENLGKTDLSESVGKHLLSQIKARKLSLQLSEAAYKYSNGLGKQEDIFSVFQQFEMLEQKGDEYVSEDTDLDNILDQVIRAPGLRWRLDFFNKSLGSLRPGDFGFFFKRPESGGTAMMASEASFMIDQADRPIIWFNNEEVSAKVILRIYQAYFGITQEQILANHRRFRDEFRDKVGRKFQMYGHDYSNKKDIEAIIRQENPALVIYDQIDGVKGFAADRNDLMLGEIYKWARGLAKAGHAAIAVTQADGTAENQRWLTMAHVSEAKTTKQATADFIIGMGMVSSEGNEYSRFLNISKNKMVGDQDSIPNMRHGRAEVRIIPEVMRFKDLVTYK